MKRIVLGLLALALVVGLIAETATAGREFAGFKPSRIKQVLVAGDAAGADIYCPGLEIGDEIIAVLEITGTGAFSTGKMVTDSVLAIAIEADSLTCATATYVSSDDSLLVTFYDIDG